MLLSSRRRRAKFHTFLGQCCQRERTRGAPASVTYTSASPRGSGPAFISSVCLPAPSALAVKGKEPFSYRSSPRKRVQNCFPRPLEEREAAFLKSNQHLSIKTLRKRLSCGFLFPTVTVKIPSSLQTPERTQLHSQAWMEDAFFPWLEDVWTPSPPSWKRAFGPRDPRTDGRLSRLNRAISGMCEFLLDPGADGPRRRSGAPAQTRQMENKAAELLLQMKFRCINFPFCFPASLFSRSKRVGGQRNFHK